MSYCRRDIFWCLALRDEYKVETAFVVVCLKRSSDRSSNLNGSLPESSRREWDIGWRNKAYNLVSEGDVSFFRRRSEDLRDDRLLERVQIIPKMPSLADLVRRFSAA